MVYVGSFDENAGGMVESFPLLLLGRIGAEVGVYGGSRAPEDVEGDYSLD